MKVICRSVFLLLSLMALNNPSLNAAPTKGGENTSSQYGTTSSLVNEKLTYSQFTTLCPQKVICDSEDPKSCHLSDNKYDLWDKPVLENATSAIKGEYFLEFVQDNDQLKKRITSCHYLNGRWDTFRQFDLYFKYSDVTIFSKLNKETSKWNSDGFCFNKGVNQPIDPEQCPLIQAPGVAITDNKNIKLFYPNPNSYYEPNFIASKWLTYDQLHTHCGATSSCIIDIGVCDADNDNCDSYGAVYLDISAKDIVKITKIYSYKVPGNDYVFKQKQPFNMIYSE